MAKKLELIYNVLIFYIDNTVLGVTTESKEKKKTGYYLCKKLISKHSTAG